ncbi:MAG: alpha/beta fold hydrolase [bacterium]
MKFNVNKELFPFKNNFLQFDDGTKIHYVDEGEGPVLLMLHGNPTWSFLYRKMIAVLKSDFRCIAPDFPGFGLSEQTDTFDFLAESHSKALEEFLLKSNIDRFILVAQDWGGPIGLRVAEKYPDKIKGAILGNTWAWPLKGNYRSEGFSWLMGGPVGRWMAKSFNGVWQVFMKKGFYKKPSKETLAMYKAPFADNRNRIQTAIFPRQLVKAYEFEKAVEQNLNKIGSTPVLFTWGTKDFAFREDQLERFKEHFPNHQTQLLEAGHFWQEEQGENAADLITAWYQNNF